MCTFFIVSVWCLCNFLLSCSCFNNFDVESSQVGSYVTFLADFGGFLLSVTKSTLLKCFDSIKRSLILCSSANFGVFWHHLVGTMEDSIERDLV